MPSPRIRAAFEALAGRGETGIIPYLTVGYPTVEATPRLVAALVEGGACLIELGVPFSDPIADGPTIQAASFHALGQGITLARCLQVVEGLRGLGVTVPLVLMSYYNPILSHGLEPFARAAAAAGVDGVITADLPGEEAGPLQGSLATRGIDLIALLAPTSTEERVARACAAASGFVYCVSLTGVTGARRELPPGVPDLVRLVRRHTQLPIAVGFGVSRREHVEAISHISQAAVVGSALIDRIREAPEGRLTAVVRDFILELRGVAQPAGGRAK